MFGIFMGSQVPLLKICKNCNQEKRANSFFKSQRSRDGLSALCKSCRSISEERYDVVKYSFPELEKFENRSRKKAMGVRREIEKFRNEYRSGHWEPAILCLGRVCEAQVFELAQRKRRFGFSRPRTRKKKQCRRWKERVESFKIIPKRLYKFVFYQRL